MRSSLLSLAAFVARLVSADSDAAAAGSCKCKCIPGDACWPAPGDWNQLNSTLGGRLIATSLLAEVCHDPHYNATACQALKAGWDMEVTQ